MLKIGDEKTIAGVTFRFDGHTWVPISGPPPDRRIRDDGQGRTSGQASEATSDAENSAGA